MYINRLRPHDTDTKRREFARNRAIFLDSKRNDFIEWCMRTGVQREQMELELTYLEEIIWHWNNAAEQGAID